MKSEGAEEIKTIETAPLFYVREKASARTLTDVEVVKVLKRDDLTEEIIMSITEHKPWAALHKVQVGLVSNPRTPRVTALQYVYFLYWRELVDVLNNLKILPAVRNAAESLLEEKLGDMSLGEKIALAKAPFRGIVRAVRKLSAPEALKALLKNPSLTEDDVLFLIHRRDISSEILEAIAKTPKWLLRHAIRFELVRNAQTPRNIALNLIGTLPTKDLEGIASSGQFDEKIRAKARSVMRERSMK